MKKKMLKAVLINPETKTVQDIEIENDLHELQKIVDGYIETVSFAYGSGHVLIVNEEGTFRPSHVFAITSTKAPYITIIHGTALLVGMGNSDFINSKLKASTVEKMIEWE